MFVPPQTIAATLAAIEQSRFVLPAVQREFVWPDRKITALFDSLMRGYPIGTFLFWHVEDATVASHAFYGFVKHYDPRGEAKYCPRMQDLAPSDNRFAVLDGQQRLTSLRIGITGSHTIKLPRAHWNNPDAFQKRLLYLDVKAQAVEEDDSSEDETGDVEQFLFRFRTTSQAAQETQSGAHLWVKVADALGVDSMGKAMAYGSAHFPNDAHAVDLFARLVDIVNSKDIVTGYLEQKQQIDRVMNIFIRVNAQGEPLSFADLLLSQATAAWAQGEDPVDAREEIRSFVDKLNAVGNRFSFKRDQIMKSTLLLTDAGSIRFRIENYDTGRMRAIRDEWDGIKKHLTIAAQLLAKFGFSADNLRANSVLHPLAYYVKHRGLDANYVTSVVHDADRELVRRWVVRTMLKQGIWGSGLDTLLTRLRAVIKADGTDGFPYPELGVAMNELNKGLDFSDGDITGLLELRYGNRETFALLSLLYPTGATADRHHVDHVYPRAQTKRKAFIAAGLNGELAERVDGLANLQLLTPSENISKQDRMPSGWLTSQFPDPNGRAAMIALHEIHGATDSLADFESFLAYRSPLLEQRIRAVLA